MHPRISIRGCVRPSVRRSVGPSVRRSVGPSVTLSWKVEKWNIYGAKNMAKLIWYVWCALPHLYDRICPSVGLSVKISDSLSLSISLLSQGRIVGLWALLWYILPEDTTDPTNVRYLQDFWQDLNIWNEHVRIYHFVCAYLFLCILRNNDFITMLTVITKLRSETWFYSLR